MKRKHLVLLFALTLVLSLTPIFTANGSSEESMKLYINDAAASSPARIIDGKLYLPADDISRSFDMQTEIDSQQQAVTVKSSEMNVPDVIDKVSPSVVGIIGKIKKSSTDYYEGGDNLAFGTGLIYKSNGYIITNAHVVKDLESIVVVLSNSKTYKARLKAMDEKFDLAMIKIDKGELKPAVFGDISDVTVGEPVVAIGTPMDFSFRNSATKGIISGMNRSADGEYKFIQSDAAINGGNSGGPLVNMKGEVIGINSIKYVGFGVEGLSFSIPIDTVKYVIGQFEKYGKVRRPYLGVEFAESVAAMYGLPSSDGLTITGIDKDSPAEKAGLQMDDVVTAVDGRQITTKLEYNEVLKDYLPGDKVLLSILRNGSASKVQVEFGEGK